MNKASSLLPQPRPYQKKNIEEIREAMRSGKRRVLYQCPTGGGKSVVLGAIMAGAASKRRRVLTLVHRYELVRQLVGHFSRFGFAPHVLAAGGEDDPNATVTVASVQTAAKRELSKYDLVLVDEAHHACAGQWDAVLKQQEGAFNLGVTATPRRLDGRGLDSHFDVLVTGPHTRQLQADGFLAQLDVHAAEFAALKQLRLVNDNFEPHMLEAILGEFTKTSLDSWEEIAGRTAPTIAFCASVRHCEFVEEAARARGIMAKSVHSNMKSSLRDEILKDYAQSRIGMLLSCDLIDEGFDVPETSCVLQLRPTASLVKHFQQIGRGMRPKADGGPCILIDMAGNIERIREAEGAGLPTEVLDWTLEGRIIGKKKKPEDERELMESESGPIVRDPMADVGRAIKLIDRFASVASISEALDIVEQPSDFHVLRQQVPNAKGKRVSPGVLIQFCRNKFFPADPLQVGLDKAAAALGYERYLSTARRKGEAWIGGFDHSEAA